MDDARASAAVDLVLRPHAEVALAFRGDRIGGLAPTLLPHALERLAVQGRFTLHLDAAGEDDHHVAEAAFKALGRALRLRAGRRRHPLDEGRRMKIVLADYGAGNLRSVCSAFERAGAEAVASADPGAVREARLAVVAGVGNFASASRVLAERRLADALRERAAAGRPVLGICVGMQLLFEASEEGGEGLALLHGAVRRLRARRVPHMGWNALAARDGSVLLDGLDGADAYFAHSFACEPDDPVVTVAETDHEGPVCAAVERGALAGVQFHPERSASTGARLLRNVLAWSRSA
jgi:glutamine amidotransferase